MRIAYVSSTFDKRHRRRVNFLQALIDSGHECLLVVLDIHKGLVSFPDQAVIISKPDMGASFFAKKRSANTLRASTISVIEDFSPDCVICLEPESLFAGVYFKKKYGTRFIYDVQECHGHTTNAGKLRRLWVYKEERKSLPYIDNICVLSDAMQNQFAGRYTKLPPIKILSNAFFHKVSPKYNGYLHAEAAISRDKNILLYHGYLTHHRGLEWLAEFANNLPDNWHTVMMGWGELEPALQKKTNRQLSVIPPVPVEDLLDTICGAKLGAILYDKVNLNHEYSTPNKLYEYPAAGIPIVCEHLPEIVKVVEENELGWVVSKTDSADKILQIFSDGNATDLAAKQINCSQFTSKMLEDKVDDQWVDIVTNKHILPK